MVFPSTLSATHQRVHRRRSWRERALAIGLWGAMTTGVAIALGPIVGGWLLELFGWRSIFFRDDPDRRSRGGAGQTLRTDLARPARACRSTAPEFALVDCG